jgi:PTS system mannose-specific IIA component
MIRAVLVTHGRLGAELLRACETILGPQEGVEILSNEGCSLDDLAGDLASRLPEGGERVYMFVDLLGGSCTLACQEVRRTHPEVVCYSGVNLPMILEFLYYRDRVPAQELEARLLEKGRAGIQRL